MSDTATLLEQLAAPGAKLTQIIGAVERLEPLVDAKRELTIGVSSNVSVDLLSVFLRKHALLAGVRLAVEMGSHDDPVTDAMRFAASSVDAMVYLPFFDNLMPSFEDSLELLPAADVEAKEADFRARCTLVFRSAQALPAIYVGTLHRYGRPVDTGRADPVDAVLARFNATLREVAREFVNVRILDTAPVVQSIGAGAAFDRRFYLRSTAPYAPPFLDEFARQIALASRGFGTYFYKALVLDCDNTLWGGIIGEDLLEGIRLDPHSYPGRVYWQAQQTFAALERNGVLICLCSKNNPEDVDEVLERHPHTVLKHDHLTLKKVNWTDKVTNLQEIARELNIGLDSLVFVDDSPFEAAAVRAALPQVRVVELPPALTEYGRVLREVRELFLAGGVSDESRSKTDQYRQLQKAAQEHAQFATHEEYLASLDLRVELRRNSVAELARISELTQKSNQFNLTTLRQTPGEIRERMESDTGCVYSLTVFDKFGSAGLTGVAIVRWTGETAVVDAFLMSCRVIGRGVEFAIWPVITRDAAARGCRVLEAEFRPTAKNAQVSQFYEQLGLTLIETTDGVKRYRAEIADFHPPRAEWIKVTHGE
ncbi:HAD-IIIC family phosphatase [Piscinibacter koreensis]|uniref:HAD-IIIC family phosphatase n=1 Tax=Piscinibacter koreensis TaxID=2742824 RepID=A0A7Y6NRW1_9BURK|nr:HAD-IIIC family phosphatase [Schlegelella koreensis]NUZ08191.1 HAD-IIIC family phosphatase [Schlegelella koreensis]